MTVRATEARKRWFELLKRVESGEKVVILYNGKKLEITSETRPTPGIKSPDKYLFN